MGHVERVGGQVICAGTREGGRKPRTPFWIAGCMHESSFFVARLPGRLWYCYVTVLVQLCNSYMSVT